MSVAPTIVSPVAEEASGWWASYRSAVAPSMSPTSLGVLTTDADYVTGSGIYALGDPGPSWPSGRARSGLVMGAVQSGKTASMLGVCAMALDRAADVIVVLAGTRTSLWRQTYERLAAQLCTSPITPSRHDLLPSREAMASGDFGLDRLYFVNGDRARRLLTRRQPLVFVVMKNVHHIRAAADVLRDAVYPLLDEIGRPVHILVVDDEADDGSILDRDVEQATDPRTDALKQIPRHVVGLWGRHGDGTATAHPNLYATYVAYTATPQANLLQAEHNPLSPRDFLAALRVPAGEGSLSPRRPTFHAPGGPPSWYCGGEIFYRSLPATTGFVVDRVAVAPTAPALSQQMSWIGDSVRSYLVAGAVRRCLDGRSMPTTKSSFETREAARAACPPPHTMLVHPSGLVADHFAGAALILAWAAGCSPDEARERIDGGERRLPSPHLIADLAASPDAWRTWHGSFEATAVAIADRFGLAQPASMPIWSQVEERLRSEIFPNVRVAIVNSDPDADDRPRFEPVEDGAGRWAPAPDLSTIFVSGNVMARGLTLEGLTTTLFLRASGEPLADTQQQMQRWFGYRGAYLELCRIFTPPAQRQLFEQYHDADEALRTEIIARMNDSADSAPGPIVLEGERYRATGKLVGIGHVPLCPDPAPLVRFVNVDGGTPGNFELLRQVVREPNQAVEVGSTFRGYLADRALSLNEAADLLDRLRYDEYVPDPDDDLAARWASIGLRLGLGPNDALFRPPSAAVVRPVQPLSCPYTVAAYLRLWAACLTRHARGLVPTDDGAIPWSAVDLGERSRTQPRFHLGVRSGRGPEMTGSGFDQLPSPLRLMERSTSDGQLLAAWGGRSAVGDVDRAYLGDRRFDQHVHPGPEPTARGGARWRPRGSDGLILLQPVAVGGATPAVVVGVAIPLGGPDHFAARRQRSSP